MPFWKNASLLCIRPHKSLLCQKFVAKSPVFLLRLSREAHADVLLVVILRRRTLDRFPFRKQPLAEFLGFSWVFSRFYVFFWFLRCLGRDALGIKKSLRHGIGNSSPQLDNIAIGPLVPLVAFCGLSKARNNQKSYQTTGLRQREDMNLSLIQNPRDFMPPSSTSLRTQHGAAKGALLMQSSLKAKSRALDVMFSTWLIRTCSWPWDFYHFVPRRGWGTSKVGSTGHSNYLSCSASKTPTAIETKRPNGCVSNTRTPSEDPA